MRFSEQLRGGPEKQWWEVYRVTQTSSRFTLHPWVTVEKSSVPGAGFGVFANRDFPAKKLIGCYVGRACVDKDEAVKNGDYALEVCTGACTIDGAVCGNWTAYINDQERCHNVRFNENGEIWTRRAIKSGEELFMSYGPSYWRGEGKRKRGDGRRRREASPPKTRHISKAGKKKTTAC